MGKMRSILQK